MIYSLFQNPEHVIFPLENGNVQMAMVAFKAIADVMDIKIVMIILMKIHSCVKTVCLYTTWPP